LGPGSSQQYNCPATEWQHGQLHTGLSSGPGAKEGLAARFNGVNVVAIEVAVKKAKAMIAEVKRIGNWEVGVL